MPVIESDNHESQKKKYIGKKNPNCYNIKSLIFFAITKTGKQVNIRLKKFYLGRFN
jgi:hypothetical protein